MNDLQTLRDIEPKFKKGTDLVATDFLKEQLKQEAIKWVNLYKEEGHQIIKLMLYFFNITEEDLK